MGADLKNKLRESKRELRVFRIGHACLMWIYLGVFIVSGYLLSTALTSFIQIDFSGLINFIICYGLLIPVFIYFYDLIQFINTSISNKILQLEAMRVKLLREKALCFKKILKEADDATIRKELDIINKEIVSYQSELFQYDENNSIDRS